MQPSAGSGGYIWWSHSDVGVFALLSCGPLQAQGAIFSSHTVMWAHLHSFHRALAVFGDCVFVIAYVRPGHAVR